MFRTGLFGVLVASVVASGVARGEDKSIDGDGFIKNWLLLAPIKLAEGESSADAVAKEQVKDEAKLEPKAGDKVKVGDKELAWKAVVAEEHFFDFNKLLGEVAENAVGYAVATVTADDEKKDVFLRIGSDDTFKLWLNGKEIGKGTEDRALDKDQDKFEGIALKKGVNVLVFKVVNASADWTGCARFVDKDGAAIKGLTAEVKK